MGVDVDMDMDEGTATDMPILPRGAWEYAWGPLPDGLNELPLGVSAFGAAGGVAATEDGSVVASVAIWAEDGGGNCAGDGLAD